MKSNQIFTKRWDIHNLIDNDVNRNVILFVFIAGLGNIRVLLAKFFSTFIKSSTGLLINLLI